MQSIEALEADMRITPVNHERRTAGYPTREILNTHPELLRRLPNRWQGNGVLLSAVVATGAIVTTRWSPLFAADTPVSASRVAPIFEHGDGRGSFGCDAVAPPVFLAEDEARQVIVEEMKTAGVTMTPDGETLPEVALPVTLFHIEREPTTKVGPLVLDGIDAQRRMGYEYVSEADYLSWQATDAEHGLIETYDYIGAAKTLRSSIEAAKPSGAYGVFYDPMPNYFAVEERMTRETAEGQTTNYIRAGNDLAREELRAQVKDFIAWLKTEGVI
jgi:hypothetical protein